MAIYRCYRLAAALSRKHWHAFLREVGREVYGRHRETRQLIEALRSHHPDFAVPDAQVFAAAFPGKAFSEGRFRLLRSYMSGMLEEFIVRMALRERPQERTRLLVAGLYELGELREAGKVIRDGRRAMASPLMEIEDLRHDFQLELLELDLYIRQRQKQVAFDWANLISKLEQQSLADQLRLLCAMVNAAGFRGNRDPRMQAMVARGLATAGAMRTELHPLAAIYFHLLSLLDGGDLQIHFAELEQLFREHDRSLSRTERMNLFAGLINFLLCLDRKGTPRSLQAVYRSLREMHRQDLIFGAGAFSVSFARNLASVAARMQAFDFAQEFLEELRERLDSPANEHVYHYGAAYLHFAQKNYSSARKHLHQADFSNPFFRIANDNLMLRIAYESNADDTFFSTHSTLSRHLYRKEELTAAFRNALRNLLRLLTVMYDLRWGPRNPEKMGKLQEMLAATDDVFNRDWILASIREIEAR
ncbi:MAG: hypothetical protein AAF998_15640 [Bacteroidota bacterium]